MKGNRAVLWADSDYILLMSNLYVSSI